MIKEQGDVKMNEEQEKPSGFVLQEELEGMKDMEGFEKMMNIIARSIHPDLTKMSTLTSALKNIKDVGEVMELSEGLSERLLVIQVDLYALMKDIVEEKKIPQASIEATDNILKLAVREF